MNMEDALGASSMTTAVIMSALIRRMTQKGYLNGADIKEIHEDALLMLEERQVRSPSIQAQFELARGLLELVLQPPQRQA